MAAVVAARPDGNALNPNEFMIARIRRFARTAKGEYLREAFNDH
jgi:hypothetical protein